MSVDLRLHVVADTVEEATQALVELAKVLPARKADFAIRTVRSSNRKARVTVNFAETPASGDSDNG